MALKSSRVWFITGSSSGLGRALVEAVVARGERVWATARNVATLRGLARSAPDRIEIAQLDLTRPSQVARAVKRAIERLGRIDVLVNNAGYSHEGTIEESSLGELRRQLEVNTIGPVAVVQAVLPHMRSRRSGHIINVTSAGGLTTVPGLGLYHASKLALEGITGALRREVEGFGIRVTAVEPGALRTDWAGPPAYSRRSIEAYDLVMEPLGAARRHRSGHGSADPASAARVILELANASEAPRHLAIGSDAVRNARAELEDRRTELAAWERVSMTPDPGKPRLRIQPFP